VEKGEKRGAESLWSRLAKYRYVLIVILIGIIFLSWPERGEIPQQTNLMPVVPAEISETAEKEDMARQMEEILSKMQGVGQVKVLLSVEKGEESVLSENTSLSYSGQTSAPADYNRTSEPLRLSKGSGGEEVYVTQQLAPRYRGALVVCEGGGDAQVKLTVIEAVAALTGLGSDKIAVVKWQS